MKSIMLWDLDVIVIVWAKVMILFTMQYGTKAELLVYILIYVKEII